jgi:Holliday junction resolvase
MSRASRDKGNRIERQIVALHAGLGVKAERVPLSGAAHYQSNGGDIDVYAFGAEVAPLAGEVKARDNGEGFARLGDSDVLFLRRDRAEPVVATPWRIWARLMRATARKPLLAPLASLSPANGPPQAEPSFLRPAERAVVADDGREIGLKLYSDSGAVATVALDPVRAIGIAGALIAAALRRLRLP